MGSPRTAGGPTDENNLALACVGCSLRKGARQRAADAQTGANVPLFDPRRDTWSEHLRWEGVRLEGSLTNGGPRTPRWR